MNYTYITNNALKHIKCSKKGVCMEVAEMLTKAFLKNNIRNFKVIEGYVCFNGNCESQFQHTWLELANRQKIDKTLIQFKGWDLKNVHYCRAKKTFTPEQYLEWSKMYPV